MKTEYLTQAWLVLILAIVMGSALAAVEIGLRPIIEENRRQEALAQVASLIPAATQGRIEAELSADYGRRVIKALDDEGKQVGWVIQAEGPGFAGDPISVLIGVDPSAQLIRGVYVMEQKETPGSGSKITQPSFLKRFQGKCADGCLKVEKQGDPAPDEVQAITGATLSSVAMVKIVNRAAVGFRQVLFADKRRETPTSPTSQPDPDEGTEMYGS